SAEPSKAWAEMPAVKVGERILSRANIGRLLVQTFGQRMLRARIFREQLLLALEAKSLTVDPADVAEERKAVLADLSAQGYELEAFLKKYHVTKDGFEFDVWNVVAGRIVAKKVGIPASRIPHYLSINHKAHGSDDVEDPVFARIGESRIMTRPLVEELLPLVTAQERNRFLEGVRAGEAVESALEGKITEPTHEDIKRLEDAARAKILKGSRGKQTLEMILKSKRQSLAAYRRSLRRGERVRRAIIGETEESELRAHFDRWRVFFEGRKVRVSHILIRCLEAASDGEVLTARRRIDAARVRLLAGEDFALV
ncbi:MAG: hypothetical protein GY704_16040, partial [Phycisphaeraceae bacterium]|nr:hypothetical protein [Phycisphaeraceae bacterium]